MTKRIYHPVDKAKIKIAIDAWKIYYEALKSKTKEEWEPLWDKAYRAYNEMVPGSNVWASSLFQPMAWSGTLTVDNVYNTIIASGMNTTLEECDE